MMTFRRLHSVFLLSLFGTGLMPAVRAADTAPPPAAAALVSLDFPGGTFEEFIAELEAACEGPINLVRSDTTRVSVPAIRVTNVSLDQVFAAIESAEPRIKFRPATNDSESTVWAVQQVHQSIELQTARSYSVDELLEDYSINDLTTAIGTAWEMARSGEAGVDPRRRQMMWAGPAREPEMKFHQETRLLIIRGTRRDLDVAENVLDQLAPPKASGRSAEDLAALPANVLDMEANRLALEAELQQLQKESPDDPRVDVLKARLRAIEARIRSFDAAANAQRN